MSTLFQPLGTLPPDEPENANADALEAGNLDKSEAKTADAVSPLVAALGTVLENLPAEDRQRLAAMLTGKRSNTTAHVDSSPVGQ